MTGNPKLSWSQLRTTYKGDGFEERIAEFEGMVLARFRVEHAMDFKDEFTSLDNGWCECPHYGYVISGRAKVVSAHDDDDVILEAGDVYYQAPGHRVEFLEATELLELSPSGPYWEVVDGLTVESTK